MKPTYNIPEDLLPRAFVDCVAQVFDMGGYPLEPSSWYPRRDILDCISKVGKWSDQHRHQRTRWNEVDKVDP